MKTNIQIFKNEMFGEIRTMTNEKGETFFVGKDVAQALGYSNSRKALLDHVDEEDKGVTKRDTLGTGEVVHALGDLRDAAVGVVPYHHAGGEGDEHDSLLRGGEQ